MKTIEEKAKAYDEALKAAIAAHKDEDRHLKATLERIFPELKESEDEKVRKEIVRFIQMEVEDEIVGNKWLAWLEKQGEHANFCNKIQIGDKVTRNKDGVLVNLSQLNRVAKPADKAEPKFKVGDWITNGDYTWKIVEVEPLDYILQSQDGNIVDDTISHVDEQFHSFTIEAAKDGDVLSDGTAIFIFKDLLSDGSVMSYCDYDTDSGESDAFCPLLVNLMCSKITPATKEQRDTLFAKIHEAGYIWDAKKKELKKIEQKSQRMISAEAKEAMYDKPAWSEKDEQHIDSLLKRLDGLCRNEFERTRFAISEDRDWLTSLKERIE